MQSLLDDYYSRAARGDIQKDHFQEKVAIRLDALMQQVCARKKFFAKKEPVQGVYIHGGVGRGKSMLMDLFYAHLPQTIAKKRIHFHAFMIETHDWLHEKRSKGAVDDLLPLYAKHVAAHVKILCFDEFHVTDVADAMILSRLFTALMDLGVVIVATTNWPPDRLYEGGLQRERFLPFIALLKERMDILHLDSDTDYRAVALQDLETYLFPLNRTTKEKADAYFAKLSDAKPIETMTVRVKGRDIPVHAAGGAARFTFSELCEHPHGAEDYLKIAQIFHSVFIEGIPKLGYDRRNETKRLMTLIDVLYDMRKRVVITAEAAPDKLYFGHDYQFEFDRTISRLKEMQSSTYAMGA
jgi:cell division protein ZapE